MSMAIFGAGIGSMARTYRKIGVTAVSVVAVAVLLSSCSSRERAVDSNPKMFGLHDKIPEGGGTYKVGNRYQIQGQWFTPRVDPNYDRVGIASWYGEYFHGRKTANGEWYDMNRISAAHPTLPMPTYARVTNLENGRSLVVRINDRGPFAKGREIDLSKRAAEVLGFQQAGTARVRVAYITDAPLEGDVANMQYIDHSGHRPFYTASTGSVAQDAGSTEVPEITSSLPAPTVTGSTRRPPRPVFRNTARRTAPLAPTSFGPLNF